MNRKSLVVHGPFNIGRCGGAGRYGQQLYNQLNTPADKASQASYDVFFPNAEESIGDGFSSESQPTRLVRMLKHAAYRGLPPVVYERLQYAYQRKQGGGNNGANGHVHVPIWERNTSPVLLHELTNYNVISNIGKLSLSPNLSLVVTFLDIQDFYYPDRFRASSLNSRRLLYSFFKDRADYFFAISEFTKQTMVERLGIPPEKIKVTHLAADDMLLCATTEEDKRWAANFGRFLIYPAKALKHKNHKLLIAALGKRQKECRRAGLKLLLTGGFNKNEITGLKKLISEHGVQETVCVLGFVSDVRLQALIKGAEFLIFPSLFEGFGMPILEAMTLGCPVISSDAGSLPEVGGDGAVYFDPRSEDELVALIDGILEQKGFDRNGMIEKGFVNCQRFSWRKMCNETVAVYNELLGQ